MQRKIEKMRNSNHLRVDDSCLSTTSSTSSPGGNQVDRLPPASSVNRKPRKNVLSQAERDGKQMREHWKWKNNHAQWISWSPTCFKDFLDSNSENRNSWSFHHLEHKFHEEQKKCTRNFTRKQIKKLQFVMQSTFHICDSEANEASAWEFENGLVSGA